MLEKLVRVCDFVSKMLGFCVRLSGFALGLFMLLYFLTGIIFMLLGWKFTIPYTY